MVPIVLFNTRGSFFAFSSSYFQARQFGKLFTIGTQRGIHLVSTPLSHLVEEHGHLALCGFIDCWRENFGQGEVQAGRQADHN